MNSAADYERQPSLVQDVDRMRNAPVGYECPFCRIAQTLPAPAPESAVVLAQPSVFAFVPLHHYAGIRGNCLIAPRLHYENALDIPDALGNDFFRATRLLAQAMRQAFGCEGISTRQHNGPAGDQDVWHYHLHVFPRFRNDELHAGEKSLYSAEDRFDAADRLRVALRQ
jgi:histidine triad (HIT) family protein